MICPYCDAPLEEKPDTVVYSEGFGRELLICSNYPECDAYCTILHRDKSGNPLGRVANKELRRWKNNAHACFDAIWKQGYMNRGEAYKWLADLLEIPRDECHISYFGLENCKLTVAVSRNFRRCMDRKEVG